MEINVLFFDYNPMISRLLKKTIHSELWQKKAIIILGPRQVGKTTLAKELILEDERS